MNWQEHLVSDQQIVLGKPVLKGTRISVEHIVNLLAHGWTEKMILENYPAISSESVRAIFAYLLDCLKDNLYMPIQQPSG